jgi:hypothetical protein
MKCFLRGTGCPQRHSTLCNSFGAALLDAWVLLIEIQR